MPPPRQRDDLGIEAEGLVELLRAVVEVESWSNDPDGLRACARLLERIGNKMLGRRGTLGEVEGSPYMLWEGRDPQIALLGHFDTVWPPGTLERLPFRVIDGRVHGPGTLDMKAGIVMGLAAAAAAGMDRLSIMLTPDEELGSPRSRGLIEALARRVSAVLVLEPASGESLKIARKGVAVLRLRFRGRAAHAGLEPKRGLNATVEAAHAIVRAASLSDQEQGTTVTPTVVRGGDVPNAVPDEAHLIVDVRAWSEAELRRVEEALRSYAPTIDGVIVHVERASSRPPLTSERSEELFALAQRVGNDLGLAPLTGARVGGGSDGCLTAAVGTPTLDGLGAIGDGAHTEDEHVVLDDLIPRTRLVARLIEAIRGTLPSLPADVPGSEGRDGAAELAPPDLSHSQRMERMA